MHITPALRNAGWDEMTQLREEVSFTKGRIIVRGKLVTRGKAKRADYILYYKPNIPLAVIEAKDNACSVGDPEGPTGAALMSFVDDKLFPAMQALPGANGDRRARCLRGRLQLHEVGSVDASGHQQDQRG